MAANKNSTSDRNAFRTSEIAAMIGVHPNTIRFYEEQGLLPPIPRMANGYRVFSDRHLTQLRLIRCAFRAEILSDNMRNEVVGILKTVAEGRLDDAKSQTIRYQKNIKEGLFKAGEAIAITKQLLSGGYEPDDDAVPIGRREAAAQVGVSVHILRDWERNGLISIPRKGNRRQYGAHQMDRLKIISVLRNANYSQTAVRRMLQKMEHGETDLLSAIDTPDQTEDIVSVADRYITSLTGALGDIEEMLSLLKALQTGKL
ncbi:MAG: MerR family transcriptional regulator [Oscillospiraceae bacterium]|jgi:DNA-binding transcriptional MerR regulator|nr:MerR family transcriptional regulator [Oscillospiraceae bacterium]